ncbi:MAG: LuxR C-terminal-related transcriptional regulator, partial [Anaerolineales bacterium]|nr:LuxR C-terminal-related transcriptional regulator [Anaerolineales bacterium]
KLYIPPPRPDLVPRPRLTERLEAGTRGKLTLVSAPAGYGKSTLVSEWVARSNVPVAWLSLDASDNDLARFFSYLIAALQGINPYIGVDIQSIREVGTDHPIENLLAALVNAITTSTPPFVMVLDDYHNIHELKVHQALDFLLDHLPPGMHMLIISRTIPPMPLGRLRVQRELSEIREVDLRFSFNETTSFLNDMMGLALSPEEVQKLEARTEGWIAGLQLAVLALQDRQDKGDLITAFSGSHSHLIEYLVQEVMSRLPEEVSTFLLYTSLMEKFNAPLCNALMQGTNGREMLNHLEKANLFLNPLDDQRNWYRYHHLFADFLRQRIRGEQPEIVPILFARASQWYETQGLVDEAIEYALLGDDFVGATQLLDGIAETLLFNAEINQFISWAYRLPKKVRAQFPRLCIYFAWSLQFEYQLEAAESMLALAEAHLADPGELPKSFPASQITGHANAIRAYIAGQRGDFEEAVAVSLLAYKVLPDLETRQVDILRGILALHLGTMYNFLGQMESAHHYLEIALPLNQKAGTRYPILACLQYQMNVDFTCGALHRAGANGEKGLHWIDEWSHVEGQKRRPARMLAQLRVEMGKLHYEWNNLDQAARYWRKSIEYFEFVESYHRVSHYLNLVDLHQAMGDVEKALGYLGKVKRMRLPGKFSITVKHFDPQIVARNLLLSQSRPDRTDLFAEAVQWAESSGLKPDDEFRYEQEYEYLTLARVLTAQNKAEQAVPLLDRLISSAEGAGRNGQLIAYLSLQAVAHYTLNDTDTALKILSRALELGEPQGYLRTFVDLGSPMRDLLRIAAQQRIAPGYIGKLLAAFPTKAVQPTQQEIRELIEPLNEREMTILRYMAGKPSNQEIAEELHLSVNTVKWYARSIYDKLGVGNRRAAVIRARELGILQIS